MAEVLGAHPDLFVILDGTEQPIQRPRDRERQRAFYPGKKKQHTVKNGLVANDEGLIRAVTSSTPGAVHDLRHFRESGVLAQIPLEVSVIADACYGFSMFSMFLYLACAWGHCSGSQATVWLREGRRVGEGIALAYPLWPGDVRRAHGCGTCVGTNETGIECALPTQPADS